MSHTPADYVIRRNGHTVVQGVYGTTYNANTVDQIDANLDSIRHGQPDHPDIDRLLDARRLISLAGFLFDTDDEVTE